MNLVHRIPTIVYYTHSKDLGSRFKNGKVVRVTMNITSRS